MRPLHSRILTLCGLWLLLSAHASAATRLGLHVTQEELNIWRQRAASGPYKTAGDVSTNSPGDWTKIVNNKESFRSNSTQEFYGGGTWTVGTCISNSLMDATTAFPGFNNRTYGDKTRDAAFFAMVLPGDPTAADAAAKARTALLTQATTAKMNFASKTTFCEGVVVGDANPRHDMSLWLIKLLFAYDYLKIYGNMSPSDRTTLDPWFLQAAKYFRSMWFGAAPYTSGLWSGEYDRAEAEFDTTVAIGGLYSHITDNQCPMRGGSGAIVLYDGGPSVSDAFTETTNNRFFKQMAFVANVAVMLNDVELIRHSKMVWKTWMVYSLWPNGDEPELKRWTDTPTADEDHGWNYSGFKLGSLVEIADVFARTGDMDLYTFTTSAGVCQISASNAGGPRTLFTALLNHVQYVDHTLLHYVAGAAHDTAHLIDSVSTLQGCARVDDTYVLPQANHYYQSTYFTNVYLRRPTGGPIVPPAYPSAACGFGGADWGGAWNTHAGILFMFGQTEGQVNPYSTAPPPLSPPTNVRVTSP